MGSASSTMSTAQWMLFWQVVFYYFDLMLILIGFFWAFSFFSKTKFVALKKDFVHYWLVRPSLMFLTSVIFYVLLWLCNFGHLSAFPVRSIILQVILLYVLHDFVVYAIHFVTHQSPYLYKLHKVHHTIKSLSWENGTKDTLGFEAANLVAFIWISYALAIPLESVFIALLLWKGMLAFSHYAEPVSYPGFLDKIFISPARHIPHHTEGRPDPEDEYNFGVTLVVWDWLFHKYFKSIRDFFSRFHQLRGPDLLLYAGLLTTIVGSLYLFHLPVFIAFLSFLVALAGSYWLAQHRWIAVALFLIPFPFLFVQGLALSPYAIWALLLLVSVPLRKISFANSLWMAFVWWISIYFLNSFYALKMEPSQATLLIFFQERLPLLLGILGCQIFFNLRDEERSPRYFQIHKWLAALFFAVYLAHLFSSGYFTPIRMGFLVLALFTVFVSKKVPGHLYQIPIYVSALCFFS